MNEKLRGKFSAAYVRETSDSGLVFFSQLYLSFISERTFMSGGWLDERGRVNWQVSYLEFMKMPILDNYHSFLLLFLGKELQCCIYF